MVEGKGTGVAMAYLRGFFLLGGFILRGVIICGGLVLLVRGKYWRRGKVHERYWYRKAAG